MESFLDRAFMRSKARIETTPEHEWHSVGFLYGHMSFGLHRVLKGICTYVGLVRHPVDRVVSSYYFMREQPAHPLYLTANTYTLKELLTNDMGLYLEDNFNNHQTRILAGIQTHVAEERFPCLAAHIPQEMDYWLAIDNLAAYFSFTGCLEQMPERSAELFDALNIEHDDTSFPHVGQTSGRLEVDRDVSDIILEKNQLDLRLWEYVYASAN